MRYITSCYLSKINLAVVQYHKQMNFKLSVSWEGGSLECWSPNRFKDKNGQSLVKMEGLNLY